MFQKYYKLFMILICLVIGLLSFFVISKHFSSVDTWTNVITYLNSKKDTVMELTVTSTAASAALSALPGDAATPIASKLVDLSTYFLIILSALYLEKYMITIIPFVSFSILIPLACILFIIYILYQSNALKNLAIKLFICGLSLSLVIPSSVGISKMIENTYEMNTQLTIEETEPENDTNETTEEKNWFDSILISAQNGINNITNGISDTVGQAKTILNNLIEALAVMIVTSCLIPILVFIFFGWIIKMVFNLNFNSSLKKLTNKWE